MCPQNYKSLLSETLDGMVEEIRRTRHLSSVFTDDWIQQLRKKISEYSGEESFKTNTHAFFIGFLQEKRSGRYFIRTLDKCFGAIKGVIGRDGIGRLENQLRDLTRPLGQYWGTVFSTIIIGRCAQHGLLKSPQDYEPKVGIGNNRADALITVGENEVLLEATVCISGRELISGAIDDLGALEDKIEDKVLEKAWQLQDATRPILLFLHPHLSMTGIEIQSALGKVFREASTRAMAGVVLAMNTTIHGWRFTYVRNIYPDSKQLPETVFISLSEIFKFKELKLDAHPVEWARW